MIRLNALPLGHQPRNHLISHGSYKFDDLLFKDFSRTFNNVQGVRFHRHDYHIFSTDHCKIHFHMIQNRMRIMSLAVHLQFYCCLSFFMCDFNADSPMFEMSIIRSQHLQKAFFTQPARCLENTNSEYCRL